MVVPYRNGRSPTRQDAPTARPSGRLGDRRSVAGALAFLGDALRRFGETELAEKTLSDAASVFHELRDLGGEAETTNLYAALTFSRGAPPVARSRYAKALCLA